MSRLFIGCPIDSASCEIIAKALTPWQLSEKKVRWLRRSNWHLTLAFIGDVDDSLEFELAANMNRYLNAQNRVQAPLLNLSAFPDANSAILVALISACPPLQVLQKISTNICADLSLPLRTGPYRPHITLARRARKLLPSTSSPKLSGSLDIRQVALYRSELTDSGRCYRVIHNCSLV